MNAQIALAERAVLGSILLDQNTWPMIAPVIQESDIWDMRHKLIWRTFEAMIAKGLPIEITTLKAELELKGVLSQAGGVMYLSTLADDIATTSHAEHYARQVKEASIQRRLVNAGCDIARCTDGEVGDNLSTAFDSVSGLVTEFHGQQSQIRPIRDTIDAATDDAIAYDPPPGIVKSGLYSLDHMTGGNWPGLLTVVAGLTSMGKSAFAVPTLAVNAALAGKKVLVMSFEDTALFVQWRVLSRLAGVPLDLIARRRLTDEQRYKVNAKRDVVKALPMWIDDSSHATPDHIRQCAINQINKTGLDLLIIDRLSFVRAPGKDLYHQTTNAASAIAQISKELNIPIMLLHQLSRETWNNSNNIPSLRNLRDTGEVEQSARQVWLLHRPYYFDKTENPFEFWVIVAKFTHGQTGTLKMSCLLENMYIYDERKEGRNEF
jgi:replicative DNA helicase